MKIGYARISTITQSFELQVDALKQAGCEKIIQEQASGSIANRSELLKAKEHTLRSGDTFVVWRLDRLGRSLKDLISWTEWFAQNNIGFESICEGINTNTSTGKLFVHFSVHYQNLSITSLKNVLRQDLRQHVLEVEKVEDP